MRYFARTGTNARRRVMIRNLTLACSCILLFSGCSILHLQSKVNAVFSPDGVEQSMRYSAVQKAVNKIFISEENKVKKITEEIQSAKEALKDTSSDDKERIAALNAKIRDLFVDFKMEQANSEANITPFKKMEGKKVYLDITEAFDLMVSDKIGESLFNTKVVLTHAFEEYLRNHNIEIVPQSKEADYALKIFTKENGIERKSFFYLLFNGNIRKAVFSLDLQIVDLKSLKAIYADKSDGSAYYRKDYYLIFGPFESDNIYDEVK